ncbi:LytR/AlgR family response regulator transcription factor [Sporolituus thermophilus]|uniref:Two component transcriptional regulator, LytTR family n=1 Tax=Sporolituus thermophilus DSM 23256 TaxID=1123285 RepID=A0A1G7N5W8_9FIRM|nr:LytTR family DNA-binding domain-containing protein [Sporolituus thermophilus]SDF69468.1 two component transcriptional regulator, LytTR family [Sporolituus thermophilus DSM 23256]
MRVKTVIVDDEQPICDEIEYLLKQHIDIDVAAKFTNPVEALDYIGEQGCDLVFADIKMPGLSGLEFAKRLSVLRTAPLVVFVTAFQEHALEAFDTPAVGYITKPIMEDKLARLMGKVRRLIERIPQADNRPAAVSKICVTAGGKIIPLDKSEIALAYVKDKDVFVRTKTNEYMTALTLQEIENILAGSNFLRVHRQYIVNLDMVREIIPWFHGSYLLRMDDCRQDEVPVSRTKTKVLKSIIGLK